MKARFLWLLACPLAVGGLIAILGLTERPTAAQAPKTTATAVPGDEQPLMKNAEAFVAAFGKGDAKAVAAFWSPQGDYTGPTGRKLVGREAIEKSFAEFFAANKGLTLRIDIKGIRFVTPDVALEDGTTAVLNPDGTPPSRMRYTIVHVKKDGKWWLDSVQESLYTPPTNYDHLTGLDWAVGEWVDDVEKGEVTSISFHWTDNQNFLVSHFHTAVKNAIVTGGTQWIGWDPTAKTIRSWMFETHGGFGQGTWTSDGNKWTIRSTGVLPDGKKTAGTNTVTRVDANTITWEVRERTLDGQPLPDIKPVRMKRLGETVPGGK